MQDNEKILARIYAINDQIAAINGREIEAAHYERDESYHPMSPSQRPQPAANPDGLPNIEFYASKDVVMRGYPTLYCIAHNADHPCKYVHKVNDSLGACTEAYEAAKNKNAYEPSVLVEVAATQTHSGLTTRE